MKIIQKKIVIQKMMSKNYVILIYMSLLNYNVYIDSKYRLDKNSSTSLSTFKVEDLINLNSKRKAYISMPYAVLPPTIANIWSVNNTLTVTEDANPPVSPSTFTVTIPKGNYNVNSFIVALTTALTTASTAFGYSNTYNGAYDSDTGKLTISLVGNPGNRTFTYTFLGDNLDLHGFLGFNSTYDNISVPFPADLIPAQPNYSYTSPNVVNFANALASIYIHCNIFRQNACYDISENNSGDILKIINVSSNGFSSVVLDNGFQGLPDQKIEINNIFNSIIFFRITNQLNQIIDLDGWNWQGTILVQYSSEIK